MNTIAQTGEAMPTVPANMLEYADKDGMIIRAERIRRDPISRYVAETVNSISLVVAERACKNCGLRSYTNPDPKFKCEARHRYETVETTLFFWDDKDDYLTCEEKFDVYQKYERENWSATDYRAAIRRREEQKRFDALLGDD